jgi:multimeric flavodoxin WrbA
LKIVVIYDSKTGNTEKIARAFTEGASSIAKVEIKKIGEAFTPTLLGDVDGVAFGSPVYYADISNDMKDFLEHLDSAIKANRLNIEGKPAAVFGSYGYDGAWIMEEMLKTRIAEIGFKPYEEVCVLIDTEIKYNTEESIKKSWEFGKSFAESL